MQGERQPRWIGGVGPAAQDQQGLIADARPDVLDGRAGGHIDLRGLGCACREGEQCCGNEGVERFFHGYSF
jgi:hypothetical protein